MSNCILDPQGKREPTRLTPTTRLFSLEASTTPSLKKSSARPSPAPAKSTPSPPPPAVAAPSSPSPIGQAPNMLSITCRAPRFAAAPCAYRGASLGVLIATENGNESAMSSEQWVAACRLRPLPRLPPLPPPAAPSFPVFTATPSRTRPTAARTRQIYSRLGQSMAVGTHPPSSRRGSRRQLRRQRSSYPNSNRRSNSSSNNKRSNNKRSNSSRRRTHRSSSSSSSMPRTRALGSSSFLARQGTRTSQERTRPMR